MTYVITQTCCNDATCVEVCPVDCIHPAPDSPDFGSAEMLYIHPDECIDCGACIEACPVSAIYPDVELPPHLEKYATMNADYFAWTGTPPEPAAAPAEGARISPDRGALRVAVVGSGPAGWYVVDELVNTRRVAVEVTVLDRLPTPYGLVRHGVAPDHLATKAVTQTFARVANHRRTTLRLNVDVGRDVTHEELLEHHHAVVYATGAAAARTLGLPGEDLPGSTSAADFVGWYNGHPDHSRHAFALDHPRVVVIGNGNVALDIARILLSSSEDLRASDVPAEVLDALAGSAVEEVVVLGRRGAEHAAFTTPELLALIDHPDIDVIVDERDLADLDTRVTSLYGEERSAASFAARSKAAALAGAPRLARGAAKRLVLRFGTIPLKVLGVDYATGLRVGAASVAGEHEDLAAGLVVRATGFQTGPAPGVPLDHTAGRFRHDQGRVVDPGSGDPVPATYVAGWAKRGANGVIGTNRGCAAETVRSLLDDHDRGLLAPLRHDGPGFDALLGERGLPVIDAEAWRSLDAHEVQAGARTGRPRSKVVELAEQVRLAVGADS